MIQNIFRIWVIAFLIMVVGGLWFVNKNLIALKNENSCVTEIYHVHEHYNDFTILEKDMEKMGVILK